jgi:hypothetical protein
MRPKLDPRERIEIRSARRHMRDQVDAAVKEALRSVPPAVPKSCERWPACYPRCSGPHACRLAIELTTAV